MNRKGFTLVEILIAAALVPFVAMALYSNFSAGARLWNALRQSLPADQADLFFYKASADFDNAFKSSAIAFEGGPSKVSFASFSTLDPALGGTDGITRVSYSLDRRGVTVLRLTQDVSDIFRSKTGAEQAVLADARSFRIEYLGEDVLTHRFVWTDEWRRDDGSLPAAVRFAAASSASEKKTVWTRTFNVPAGS